MFTENMLNLIDIKHTLKYWSHVKHIGEISKLQKIYQTFLRNISSTRDLLHLQEISNLLD